MALILSKRVSSVMFLLSVQSGVSFIKESLKKSDVLLFPLICMYVCIPYVCECWQEVGIGAPGSGTIGDCEMCALC